MNNRYLVGGGMTFIGLLASIDGLARIFSGTKDIYRASKHPWLEGFFMFFGTYAPYASAVFSFLIAAFFFFIAFRIFCTANECKKPSTTNSKFSAGSNK